MLGYQLWDLVSLDGVWVVHEAAVSVFTCELATTESRPQLHWEYLGCAGEDLMQWFDSEDQYIQDPGSECQDNQEKRNFTINGPKAVVILIRLSAKRSCQADWVFTVSKEMEHIQCAEGRPFRVHSTDYTGNSMTHCILGLHSLPLQWVTEHRAASLFSKQAWWWLTQKAKGPTAPLQPLPKCLDKVNLWAGSSKQSVKRSVSVKTIWQRSCLCILYSNSACKREVFAYKVIVRGENVVYSWHFELCFHLSSITHFC